MSGYIGIDPGMSGAIALVTHSGVLADVVPMPVYDGEVSGLILGEIIKGLRDSINGSVACVIEQVGPMPKQGLSSTFGFGQSFGVALGVVGALELPLHRVRPQTWKKTFTLVGKDKSASRGKATELWPSMKDNWKLVKNDGLAEAALIAEHGRRNGL